ncbi:MAG: hypothetical protein HOH62_01525 [Verrucomicrobia bacterium]|jgi:hypothetical protein|nr:hypothetical protein [Verrucomicrobiota bacterium]MBT3841216.1 hypothetical protein [Verrucomicrobiota bacterium]MBT3912374.1 hypothetical protein [Verrucomicrobiota bacterium]MBT4901734.1 hypothetical protein [Verrucomicrobiota bacterium]MBT6102556.1 hypothetical protein [Verrucomicrobiota bacterium]
MEQQPPPQAPNPYTVVHDAPKPASIKVFGILNIVFGAMGLICGGAGVLFFVLATQSSEFAFELNRAMSAQYAEGSITFLQFSSCFGVIMSLILIVCGVGLLREQNWGRTGSLGYAAFQTLYSLASAGVSMTMVKSDELFIFSAGGAMCGVLFALIYPICILFFLTRPSVVEALKE